MRRTQPLYRRRAEARGLRGDLPSCHQRRARAITRCQPRNRTDRPRQAKQESGGYRWRWAYRARSSIGRSRPGRLMSTARSAQGPRLEHGRLLVGGTLVLAFQRTLRRDIMDHDWGPGSSDSNVAGTGGEPYESIVGNSLGLAPLHSCLPEALGGGRTNIRSFAACLPNDEALWLGVHSLDRTTAEDLHVAVLERAGEPLVASGASRVCLSVPPAFALGQRPTTHSHVQPRSAPRLFTEAPCRLAVRAHQTSVRLFLLVPDAFAVATGETPPSAIHPEDGYRGWRLP